MFDEQYTPAAEEEQFPVITLEEICDIIEDAPRMLILTHVNPDGDCIGSFSGCGLCKRNYQYIRWINTIFLY